MKIFLAASVILLTIFGIFAQEVVDYNTLVKDCQTSAQNRKFSEAISLCSDAIDLNKDDTNAYYIRAYAYSKLRDKELARTPTGSEIKIPRDQSIIFAVADAEKCIQLSPKEYPGYSLIGSLLYNQQSNEYRIKAVNNLSEAIHLGDKNKELYEFRATANKSIALSMPPSAPEAKQRAEQAIADYETYIKLSDDTLDYQFQGELYEFLGKYDLAINAYTKVLAEYENSYELRRLRGKAYLKIKKYQLAIDDLTTALGSADDDEDTDSDDLRKEILPLRMQAYKALKMKNEFCEDLKKLEEKASCDKEWKKK